MADQPFPNYSSIFDQPATISNSYDWASTQGAGDSWTGQYDPGTPALYTPQTQAQAPAATNWLDILKGVEIAGDAVGNAIRAYKGMPRLAGGPFDQWQAEETRKQQAKEDEALLDKIFKQYRTGDTSEKRLDPSGLIESSVLDPTKEVLYTGISEEDTLGKPSWSTVPRLAGEIFSGRYRNLF